MTPGHWPVEEDCITCRGGQFMCGSRQRRPFNMRSTVLCQLILCAVPPLWLVNIIYSRTLLSLHVHVCRNYFYTVSEYMIVALTVDSWMNDTLLPLNRVVDRLVLNDVLVSSFVKYYKNINCCKNVIQIKTRIKAGRFAFIAWSSANWWQRTSTTHLGWLVLQMSSPRHYSIPLLPLFRCRSRVI